MSTEITSNTFVEEQSTPATAASTAPKPPRSEAQIEAARRNGAKSKGPISSMGKANSSRNALRHGLTAFHFTLSAEEQETFNLVLADFRAEYRPKNPTEHSLVEQIAIAQWGMYRAWTAETAALNVEIETNRTKLDQLYSHYAEPVAIANAFETSLARTASLPHIHRCNVRVTRDFFRAIREIRQLRKAQNAPGQNVNFAETNPAISLKTIEEHPSEEATFPAEPKEPDILIHGNRNESNQKG